MIKRLGRAAGGWGGAQGDQLPTKRAAWGEGAERPGAPHHPGTPPRSSSPRNPEIPLSHPLLRSQDRTGTLAENSPERLWSICFPPSFFYLLSQDVSKMPGRDSPTITSWGTGGKDSLCNGVEGRMPPDHFCRDLALVDSTEFILSVPAS